MKWEKVSMNLLESFCGNCRLLASLGLLCMGFAGVIYAAEAAGTSSLSTHTPATPSVQVPAYFERNEGQFPTAVRFAARMSGYTAWFTDRDVVLNAGDHARMAKVRIRLVGSGGQLSAGQPLSGKVNYFIGSDQTKWHRGVPIYDQIVQQHAYPGIDVVYRIAGSELEYDLVAAPGADPKHIKLHFAGAKHVRVDGAGNLVLSTTAGEIRQRKPDVYQESAGTRKPLDGWFVIERESTARFQLATYDRTKGLVIDPAIVYSTYLGGTSGSSSANTIALYTDPATDHVYAYVAGYTDGPDFPTVSAEQPIFGSQGVYGGGTDAFITKFDPSASGASSVLYSTYLGGMFGDSASGIAVDSAGNAYVTGTTRSPNFPVVNAFQTIHQGTCNSSIYSSCDDTGFLSELSADGSNLLYSTYFGGSTSATSPSPNTRVNAITLDSAGHAYIAGQTNSSDLPLVNPYQGTPSGGPFVAGFDTTKSGQASLIYSTYLGASGGAFAIAADAAGSIHVGGFCSGAGCFPIVNGFQLAAKTIPCCNGGFATGAATYAKLKPSLSGSAQLVFSTYLGGPGDRAQGIAVDGSGNAYLTGITPSGWTGSGFSAVFPVTSGAFQTAPLNPYLNSFVTKINPTIAGAASLVYSTLLSPRYVTDGSASAYAISVDANGDAFVGGYMGPGLPLVNPVMGSNNGIFQSLNAGQSWTGLTQGLTDFPILALAVDASTSPRTLYAGSGAGGIFSSTDAGLNWTQVFQVPTGSVTTGCGAWWGASSNCVSSLAVDPTNPSTVYAGTGVGVFKSTDRGATWTPFNTGLGSAAVEQGTFGLTFNGSTLYAGAGDGLYQLLPGTSSWAATTLGSDVFSVAFDTRSSQTVYTGSYGGPSYKSIDGGKTWTQLGNPQNAPCPSLALDSKTSPATVYAYCSGHLLKSSDGGSSWTEVATFIDFGNGSGDPFPVAVDKTTTPSTVYVSDGSSIWKSTDGANTGSLVFCGPLDLIVLDTTSAPATLYTGTATFPGEDGFVAELNPSGSALLFSTYLGGLETNTNGRALALDNAGNMYLAGSVSASSGGLTNGSASQCPPSHLPAVNAFRAAATVPSAFFTKLGSQTLPQSSPSSVAAQVGVSTGTLTVTLPNINGSTTTSAPTVTVDPVSTATTANFSLSNNLGAYDISTTASYSGSVTLCFQALTVNDPNTFNNLQLFHIENGTAVDVTSSRDFNTRTVCGIVTSLSPFVLFSPTTSTVLASSLSPSVFGQSVALMATVAASGGTPAGTVTFYDGANTIGTATLDGSGQATLTTGALSAGTHTITAAYGGGGRLFGSTSAGFSEVVNKASTSTGVSSSANPSILNQSIMLTATVTAVATATGNPSGTITFKDGATAIGTATLNANGQATLTISSLGVGSHSVTAVYGGNSNFSGSTSAPLSQVLSYEPSGTSCLGVAGHQILQPINADGSSVWKQGRTIPAQFRVCDVKGVSIGTPGVVSSFYLTKKIAGTVTSVDETVSSTTSDTAFRWDATSQQWIFNISTQSLAANYTYVYTITLNDGTTIGFQYGLK